MTQDFCACLDTDPDAARRWLAARAMPGWTPLATRDAFGGVVAARSDELVHKERQTLLVSKGMPRISGAAASATPLDSFVRRFRDHGVSTVADLGGAFSLALVFDGREALVATDRFAIEPVYVAVTTDRLVISTSIAAVVAHPAIGTAIDPQAIYDYLYHHVIPCPRTIYPGVIKLPPAHYLHYRAGEWTIEPYWQPDFAPDANASAVALAAQLKTHLRASVKAATASRKVGAYLSGGLDSSTVTGLLGELTGAPARAYTIGFDAPGYDEMRYARVAAAHFGAEHHEYYVTPGDVLAFLPKLGDAFDGPFGNASAVPAYYCARIAADDGIDLLLAGDGGDEIFGGNERYCKQITFDSYNRVPAFLRRSLIEPIALRLPAQVPLVSKIRSYVAQAREPMPHRLQTYNLLERLGPDTMLSPALLDRIDRRAPIDHLALIYDAVPSREILDRMLGLDFRITLTDSDLPKVSRTAALAGIQVAYPMLDDALVDFSCHVPAALKLKGNQLRWFYKQALRDYLPAETIAKEKHGFGLPFGLWFTQLKPLEDFVIDHIHGLETRHILRSGYATTLIAQVREHPPYYGTIVWVLAVLEVWLRRQAPAFSVERG